MHPFRIGVLLSLCFAACATPGFAAENPAAAGLKERIVETQPRDGVTHRSLLSRKAEKGETWLVLSFPGYPGILRLAETDGVIDFQLKGNFLVRARRHLVSDIIAVATMDCPSDELAACGDLYRASDRHVRDIEAQIDALRGILGPTVRIALLGTSYGTVSTELLAQRLVGKVDAAVHTASFTAPGRGGHGMVVANLDLSQIRMRQLLVHHQDDPCDVAPYAPLKKYQGAIPILTVKGAENPRGKPCEAASQHGFAGRESQVMKRIGEWLRTDRLDPVIE
ncbi:MAG: hypothetical protein Q8O52_02955 [Sulfuritalea sp.]|nr:hypothetical protein [Sulfuritalea sp.]